jgi:S1-C subfamily serine protease
MNSVPTLVASHNTEGGAGPVVRVQRQVIVTRGAGEPMAMGFVTENSVHTISQIKTGGVADRAGLLVGDIIQKVSGTVLFPL